MPVDPVILGFSNVWYAGASETATVVPDEEGPLKILDAPRFLATKLESHASRGGGDYYHHDIEDIVAVVDGRPSLVGEITNAPQDLREFVVGRVAELLDQPAFVEALAGHLQPDDASQGRLPFVIETLRKIALSESNSLEAPSTSTSERTGIVERLSTPAAGTFRFTFLRSKAAAAPSARAASRDSARGSATKTRSRESTSSRRMLRPQRPHPTRAIASCFRLLTSRS